MERRHDRFSIDPVGPAGELDFVSPPEEAEDGKTAGGIDADEITNFRRIVEEVRTTRAELKMLTHAAAKADEEADADEAVERDDET